MNRAERRARRKARRQECEAEVAFTDFDGTQASMPCGAPATHELVLLEQESWYPRNRRVATKVRACEEHAAERQDRRYGLDSVIRLRLHPSYPR